MKRALILSGGGARGAFQVGVWKYLMEKNWDPELICGTSIGAINAVGIGAGLDVDGLSRLWTTYHGRRIYRMRLIRFIVHAMVKKNMLSLMDTSAMKEMLEREIDFTVLKKSPRKILISAVNICRARPEFFNEKEITLCHLMASSAMPLIFPRQYINGIPYWDGGVMVNTPLMPALAGKMDEIIVVLLSPLCCRVQPEPQNIPLLLEFVFEHLLIGSYQSTMIFQNCLNNEFLQQDGLVVPKHFSMTRRDVLPKIITIAPSKMLGFSSLLNFTRQQANGLIEEGYNNAKKGLEGIII